MQTPLLASDKNTSNPTFFRKPVVGGLLVGGGMCSLAVSLALIIWAKNKAMEYGSAITVILGIIGLVSGTVLANRDERSEYSNPRQNV